MSTSIQTIAFDLDDTLLNTSGSTLLTNAIKESCEAMIRAGLKTNLHDCMKRREELAKTHPHEELYTTLVESLTDTGDLKYLAEVGRKAFYERDIKEPIALFEGAREILDRLKDQYTLYLVSAGSHYTQNQKIHKLGIGSYFKKIYICDPKENISKLTAFDSILKETGVAPDSHLSVGNRLDTDIRLAKRLDWLTCWVKQGEHQHLTFEEKDDKPDFEISAIRDLIKECHL